MDDLVFGLNFPRIYGEVAKRWKEHALGDEGFPQITVEWATEIGDCSSLNFAVWLNDAWVGDGYPSRAESTPFCAGHVKWDGCANIDFERGIHTCDGGIRGGWQRMIDALAYVKKRVAEMHPEKDARRGFAED